MTRIIIGAEAIPLTFALNAPFAVAARTALEAHNVLVRLSASRGAAGLGAGVPVQYVTGETTESVLSALDVALPQVIGSEIDRLAPLLARADDLLSDAPSARAALEMALYDLWARRWRIPLWQHFGGAQTRIVTDLTIPIVAPDIAAETAKRAAASGFGCLKIKVGDPAGRDRDVARIAAVAAAAPGASLRIDANQAFSAKEAIAFARVVAGICSRIDLIEQPTAADDIDALCEVRGALRGSPPIFADESAKTPASVLELIRRGAVDGVNVKLMKSGIVGALQIATLCRSSGVSCMLGCMLESHLPLTASCTVAAGTGMFGRIDLDSHYLLAQSDVFAGGFHGRGQEIVAPTAGPGWGVSFDDSNGNNRAGSSVQGSIR